MEIITCPVCGEEIEPILCDDSFDHHFGTQYESHLECPECETELIEWDGVWMTGVQYFLMIHGG